MNNLIVDVIPAYRSGPSLTCTKPDSISTQYGPLDRIHIPLFFPRYLSYYLLRFSLNNHTNVKPWRHTRQDSKLGSGRISSADVLV